MIKYEDIKNANLTINKTSIQGKDYAEVNQRIKAFRMLFPAGFITSEIKSLENGVVVFMATVGYYDENGNAVVLGTGTAYEKENSTFINKTSYIENCETSAVGRALGMLALGIDTSVASYEEVQNAKLNQGNKAEAPKTTEVELNFILDEKASDEIKQLYSTFVDTMKGNLKTVLVSKKKKDVNELTVDEWKKIIQIQQSWIDKQKQGAK